MERMELRGNRRKSSGIVAKFRYINIVFLLVVLVLLLSVTNIIFRRVTEEASENYARFYSTEAVLKLEKYFSKDLALVQKLAKSADIIDWFADEHNEEKHTAAFAELSGFADMLENTYIYMGISESLNEYCISEESTIDDLISFDKVSPETDNTNWFFNCINSENDYLLNIDVDKATRVRRLWINHKVVKDGEIIGAVCTGHEFDEVIDELFGAYSEQNVRGYVVDGRGFIRMDSELDPSDSFYDTESHISSVITDEGLINTIASFAGGAEGYFSGERPAVNRLGDGSFISVAPISGADWMVVTVFDADYLFDSSSLLLLLLVLFLAFIVYTMCNSAIVRRVVLAPLSNLTKSVSNTTENSDEIFGQERDDEIGELAQTILDMRDRLGATNYKLTKAAKEREKQGRLLRAVNSAATMMLAADEETFNASVVSGMEIIGRCLDIDRIYVWQNELSSEEMHYTRRAMWEGEESLKLANDIGFSFSYSETMPTWKEKFDAGECVNGPLNTLSALEAEILKSYGIKSILVIPVHLRDALWGFVSFDDCRSKRIFTDEEVGVLQSASLMMANAVSRAEAAAKIREADERAKLMLDATPLCCNLWDEGLNVIDCNEEAVKLFGLKDKNEYIERYTELSPEYQENGRTSLEMQDIYIREVFEKGKITINWIHQLPDGTPIPAEIFLTRVKYGENYIIAGYARDLREYQKMMREIEHRDTLLRTVNEAAAILLDSDSDEFEHALWECLGMMADSVNADRVYICENYKREGELWCKSIFGWSSDQTEPQPSQNIVNIPYSKVLPGWEEHLSSGNSVNSLVRNMSEHTQALFKPQGLVSTLILPVFLRGHFWGVVGFADCVYEREYSANEESILRSGSLLIANALLRNEMTNNLQNALSKLQAVVSNYSGIIWSVDINNNITLFNGMYLKEIGFTPKDLEGKNLERAREKNIHADIIENVRKTIETGPQEWISESHGKMFRAHTIPTYDENGEVTGVVGSFDDLTDTIRLQRELEAAVKEAQAASQAKSNFLSNMSHEMRTPMNAIIGMTMIGKSAPDLKKKDYSFAKIEGASNHLLGVINDVLDMSKIEANKFELSEVEFNFEKVMQKVVNVINFRVEEKRQQFDVFLDSAIPDVVIGDDQRLSQVITNLLSNAVKFTPEKGRIALEARLLEILDSECSIQIDVTDTGIGISAEQQARLFTSFEQAESNTSRKFGGTGLGLAISKHIIELMNGKIWIESELGKGSKFAFIIRVKRDVGNESPLSERCGDFRNIRIMAVDDSADTREYFAAMASQLNVQCDTAEGGEEAIRLIDDNGHYNIYFIDWNMPEMNGIELTRRIKERNGEKPVVIMISATEWNEIEKEATEAGVDDFLPKPLFPSVVAECIGRFMDRVCETEDVEKSDSDDFSFKGRRILLAEDVEINREIVMAFLEPTELIVDCAVNGLEAVRMFSDAPESYDMIFMDVQMPEMDGLEATRNIRAIDSEKAQKIPIVAMTANVFREDVEKCIVAGMNAHVGKPLNFDEVLDILHQYLT